MSDFLGIDILGEEGVTAKIRTMTSEEAIGAGVEAGDEYAVEQLKRYPPQASISRAAAYPNAPYKPGFFSAKQFRFVMALVSKGLVPYHRTQQLNHGWRTVGSGMSQIVVNETPYGPYVMGDTAQANQQKMGGWNTVKQVIDQARGKIADAFARGYRRYLRSIGL